MRFTRPLIFFENSETAPGVPTPPAAPWAADAAAYFGDNADAIAGFDRYMREKQQPYITQLEEGTKDARELWQDLTSDPATALRDLVASVYADEPDVVSAYESIFNAPPETPPAVTEPPAALGEEERALLEWARTKRDEDLANTQATEYENFKAELKTQHGLDDDDLGLLDPFIYATPNDPDAAVAAYKSWKAKFSPAEETPEVPGTPPVLGSEGTVEPPTQTQYTKYEEVGPAIQNFFARQGASATPPPVVG